MAFTIPNVASAWNAIQARMQSGDLQILSDALNEVGVVSGGAVAPQGSPDMTVSVASGTVRIGGANVSVTSGNVTITANATGNPRLDLICVNGSGTKSAQAGTAAAAPLYPAIPASSVVLAAVLVPTGAASITANNIVDKRAIVLPGGGGTMASQNANAVAITGGSVTGITDLAVADGGTGASTAAGARTNLDVPQSAHSHATTDITSGTLATARLGSGTANSSSYLRGDQTWATPSGGSGTLDAEIQVAMSDETTAITSSGNPKLTMRMPHGMELTEVRASLTTASSSGAVTVDINKGGTSILSTKLTIDATERTSTTAATPAVISNDQLGDDAEMTFDVDGAGTDAKGLKVTLIGQRADIEEPSGDVEFVASSQTTYGTRTNTTITKPTGTVDGDFILVVIATGAGEAPDPTEPGGFTLLSSFPSSAFDGGFEVETRWYSKTASSEGADWTFTHSNCSSQGAAITIRNHNAGTPLDTAHLFSVGTGATSTAPTITPVTNGAMVIYWGHDWLSNPAALAPPTSGTLTFTERIDTTGPGLLYVATAIMATAGATGTSVQTNQNAPATSDGWAAGHIVIRPA
jgi:hypothetical protein